MTKRIEYLYIANESEIMDLYYKGFMPRRYYDMKDIATAMEQIKKEHLASLLLKELNKGG